MRTPKFTTFALLGLTSLVPLARAQTQVPMDQPSPGARSPDTRAPTPTRTMATRSDQTDAAGVDTREPRSSRASNIVADDTSSAIAPELPGPPVGDDADPRDYLRAARDALSAGRTGQAQQSLEMAETRLLTREVSPDAANMPDGSPRVNRVRDALHALGEGDRSRALNIIDAMAD